MAKKNSYSPLVIPIDWQGTMRNFGTQLAGIVTDIYLKLTKQSEKAESIDSQVNSKISKTPGMVQVDAGADTTLTLENGTRHFIVINSPQNTMKTTVIVNCSSVGAVTYVSLNASATSLTFTTSTNNLKIANGHGSSGCYIYDIPLDDISIT